jgi:AcrR family transcriptional regulator
MGRRREFDLEEAIAIATKLFWAKGYEGTSLNDLTEAVGITPPSFYAAFGSKEELFREVIGRYHAGHAAFAELACREPTAKAVAERLLYGYADLQTDPSHAPGCLAINSALPCTDGDGLRNWLADSRESLRNSLNERFARAVREGDLAPGSDPASLARLVVVIAWGMAVEAQSGATRAQLYAMIAAALSAWPSQKN